MRDISAQNLLGRRSKRNSSYHEGEVKETSSTTTELNYNKQGEVEWSVHIVPSTTNCYITASSLLRLHSDSSLPVHSSSRDNQRKLFECLSKMKALPSELLSSGWEINRRVFDVHSLSKSDKWHLTDYIRHDSLPGRFKNVHLIEFRNWKYRLGDGC